MRGRQGVFGEGDTQRHRHEQPTNSCANSHELVHLRLKPHPAPKQTWRTASCNYVCVCVCVCVCRCRYVCIHAHTCVCVCVCIYLLPNKHSPPRAAVHGFSEIIKKLLIKKITKFTTCSQTNMVHRELPFMDSVR